MNMISINSAKYNNPKDKETIDVFLLLGVSLMIFIHLMCVYVNSLAIIIAILENLLIFYFLLRNKNKKALYCMCLFYTTSYSNPFFFGQTNNLDTIYSVEKLPFFHAYLMILSFILLFINVKFRNKKKNYKDSNTITNFAFYTICSGVFMGILSFFVNGFQYSAIIFDINQCIIPALMIFVFVETFEKNSLFANKYMTLMLHIILSYIIMGWVTISLNIYADFQLGRDKVLMLPMPSFYFTSIILFIGLVKTNKDRLIIILAFLSSIFFQLNFDSCMNGKSWIVFTTTILVALYLLAANGLMRNFLIYGAILAFVVISIVKLVPKVNSYIAETENTKLLEFISMFTAADTGNLKDMDTSSQFRIIEFINVSEQYIEQPWFLLTGRGYGGSIHSNGYFRNRSETGFSKDQYDSDKFYRLHESMNVIYLKHGLIGLIFTFIILLKLIKGIKYTSWCYIGVVWFVFFWGYQNSLLFVGMPAMIYGFLRASQFNQINNKIEKK